MTYQRQNNSLNICHIYITYFLFLVMLMIAGCYSSDSHEVAKKNMAEKQLNQTKPVPIIFDTDMGNDTDDALALVMLHTYADQGKVELLAVTSSKDNEWVAPYLDLVNTFYGRPDIPIGMVRDGETPWDGNQHGVEYIRTVSSRRHSGKLVYPRSIMSGNDVTDAVSLHRRILASRPDRSVVFVVVGFSTNIARLLDSSPDEYSDLSGNDLVRHKVKLLSIMAGNYTDKPRKEWNVWVDLEAAHKVFKDWPTPIVASGYEVGSKIRYPATSIENDFQYVSDHPVTEAYKKYHKMPYNSACWDLTSVLYAVEPDNGYFGLSNSGRITVSMLDALTYFEKADSGMHRYLIVDEEQIEKVQSCLIYLVSNAPKHIQ